MIEGKLTKPFTDDYIKLSIKYQDVQGNWMTGWCRTLYPYNQYNENVRAAFELHCICTALLQCKDRIEF
jgi:hypothetical protein